MAHRTPYTVQPVLRGALYDYWLEGAGGYWGVYRALSSNVDHANSGVHVQLDLSTLRPTCINKLPVAIDRPLSVTVTAYDVATGAMIPLSTAPARFVSAKDTVIVRAAAGEHFSG